MEQGRAAERVEKMGTRVVTSMEGGSNWSRRGEEERFERGLSRGLKEEESCLMVSAERGLIRGLA